MFHLVCSSYVIYPLIQRQQSTKIFGLVSCNLKPSANGCTSFLRPRTAWKNNCFHRREMFIIISSDINQIKTGLCCSKDGSFLRLILQELSLPTSKDTCGHVYDMEMCREVQDCLEQCFFCMFCYPTKTRGNNFDDHHTKFVVELNLQNKTLVGHFL